MITRIITNAADLIGTAWRHGTGLALSPTRTPSTSGGGGGGSGYGPAGTAFGPGVRAGDGLVVIVY